MHVLHASHLAATEKIVLRDFLCSEEGSELKAKYSKVKQELEAQFKAGTLLASDYNQRKTDVILEIIKASAEWDAAAKNIAEEAQASAAPSSL